MVKPWIKAVVETAVTACKNVFCSVVSRANSRVWLGYLNNKANTSDESPPVSLRVTLSSRFNLD